MEKYDAAAVEFTKWNGSYLGPEGSLWSFANLSVVTVDRRLCKLKIHAKKGYEPDIINLDLREKSSPHLNLKCVSHHSSNMCVLDCDSVVLAGDPERHCAERW